MYMTAEKETRTRTRGAPRKKKRYTREFHNTPTTGEGLAYSRSIYAVSAPEWFSTRPSGGRVREKQVGEKEREPAPAYPESKHISNVDELSRVTDSKRLAGKTR